ncbi:hypothetical protein Brsp07_01940 [Brucella sp. NBRC 14130]
MARNRTRAFVYDHNRHQKTDLQSICRRLMRGWRLGRQLILWRRENRPIKPRMRFG